MSAQLILDQIFDELSKPLNERATAASIIRSAVIRHVSAMQRLTVEDPFAILEEEGWDLRVVPVGDEDVRWVVIEHHMSAPHERTIGEGASPRHALQQAMAREGYQEQLAPHTVGHDWVVVLASIETELTAIAYGKDRGAANHATRALQALATFRAEHGVLVRSIRMFLEAPAPGATSEAHEKDMRVVCALLRRVVGE